MRYVLPAAAIVAAVWFGGEGPLPGWPLWGPLVMAMLDAGRWRLWLATALAALLGWLSLHQGLAARLPESLNGEPLWVRAEVVELVEREQRVRYGEPVAWQSLLLDVTVVQRPERWPGRHRVRVSAWGPLPALHAGDRFEGRLRLYFPHGWHNQTGPDRARFFLSQRIDARGVLDAVEGTPRSEGGLHAWRQRVADRLRARLAVSPLGAAVIPALVSGDRRGLDRALNELFQITGTAHLLAISGLHLTLVTSLLWWSGRAVLAPLSQWLWPAARRFSLGQLGWVPALVGALAYAALAGFNPPVRRALIMVTVLALCRLMRRWPAPDEGLALALLAVLLIDPLAALSVGLWLSFGAVAVILLLLEGGGRLPMVLALPLPMAVAGAALFDLWAWWSPLANLLLVPLFSLLVVPAALLGAAFDWMPALHAAAVGVELGTLVMEAMAAWPAPALPPAVGWGALALAAALLLWLLPAWPWPRRLLPLCLLPWLLPDPAAPGHGQVDVVMFEVGQGQALALRTAHHVLLYDVGPGWESGSAMAMVVAPWLRRQRLTPALTLVSHGDADHAGGYASLRRRFPGGPVFAARDAWIDGAVPCLAGTHWHADGVEFRFLHPDVHFPSMGNESSCVLRIASAYGSALLASDVGAVVERMLVHDHPGALVSDVVLVAHHGSGGSSDPALVEATAPRVALVSAGHGNRFGHPQPEVVQRWEMAGAQVPVSAREGAVRVRLARGGLQLEARRRMQPRLWDAARRDDAQP